MSLLKSIARQVFGVQTARAGCPTDCWTETRSDGKQRRCCDRPDCTTHCTAWA
jgi:hypothetical protein